MYSWRGKLGWIGPSISDTVLLEFYRVLPEGVLVTTVDLMVQRLVDKEFQSIITKFEEAAEILSNVEVQAIIVGGTPPITKMGFDADKEIIKKIETLTGKPTSTAPTAEVDAIKSLGLRRIALVTPYAEELNQHLKSYLEYCGFEVAITKGLGIVRNVELSNQSFYAPYMLAKEAFLEVEGSLDGIFVQCPRWPTIKCIEPLERDLGVPVVTSPQALMWKALCLLKIHEVQPGCGKLFSEFSS
jgi:maleate isomerase